MIKKEKTSEPIQGISRVENELKKHKSVSSTIKIKKRKILKKHKK